MAHHEYILSVLVCWGTALSSQGTLPGLVPPLYLCMMSISENSCNFDQFVIHCSLMLSPATVNCIQYVSFTVSYCLKIFNKLVLAGCLQQAVTIPLFYFVVVTFCLWQVKKCWGSYEFCLMWCLQEIATSKNLSQDIPLSKFFCGLMEMLARPIVSVFLLKMLPAWQLIFSVHWCFRFSHNCVYCVCI